MVGERRIIFVEGGLLRCYCLYISWLVKLDCLWFGDLVGNDCLLILVMVIDSFWYLEVVCGVVFMMNEEVEFWIFVWKFVCLFMV